ncbi:MAG: alpha/beta fold hydrolase [Chitinophagaceae bacterium]|nr:alpha/beta fold hydrolase [Chitinophagaceae bacterium]
MTWKISPTSHLHRHWIFAFYGFGQQAAVFAKMQELSGDQYGFIVIDLPYAPLPEIPGKQDFLKEMQQIIQTYNIHQITGLSYSIGSRYNLLLAELFPDKVQKIILVAPDGITINPWNYLATSTLAGRAIFRYLMSHPLLYQQILLFLFKCGFLPIHLFAFIKWHVRNHINADKVYHTWINMKNMVPSLQLICRKQSHHQADFIAFFGKKDFIIGEQVSRKLKKELPQTKIIMTEKDHNLLDEQLFHHIASYL